MTKAGGKKDMTRKEPTRGVLKQLISYSNNAAAVLGKGGDTKAIHKIKRYEQEKKKRNKEKNPNALFISFRPSLISFKNENQNQCRH